MNTKRISRLRDLPVRKRRVLVLALALVCLAGSALGTHAQLILDLPDLILQPNLANQTFTLSVQYSGSALTLTGVQLELIVENGGPQVGGTRIGPAIEQVSVIAPGTLFAGNNTLDRGAGNFAASFPPDGLAQVFQRLTSTASGSVTLNPGSAPLATVAFDTTGGIPAGIYTWSAGSAPNGPSFFTDTSSLGVVSPILTGGTLTVVPEPMHSALAAGASLLALALGRQMSRQRRLAIGHSDQR